MSVRAKSSIGRMPRMTNTYMLAGSHDPAEIIGSVDRGLYAVAFGGGQVDITRRRAPKAEGAGGEGG